MKINRQEKVLIGREILRQELKSKYGKLYDESNLECFLDERKQKELRKDFNSEYEFNTFMHKIRVLLQTEKYVDKDTEKKDARKAMNKLLGANLTVPERYKGIIERLKIDFIEPILREILYYTSNIAEIENISVPGTQLLEAIKRQLSNRSFTETPSGEIENIHTHEIIKFDRNSSIRTIILGLQRIAREEKIDALLSEEKVRENLGIDIVSYELAHLEIARQDVLNQIRSLDLNYNQVPSKLPSELEAEVYARMGQQLQESSSNIESYKAQIKYGDKTTTVYPYKTRIYQRQGWKRAYK